MLGAAAAVTDYRHGEGGAVTGCMVCVWGGGGGCTGECTGGEGGEKGEEQVITTSNVQQGRWKEDWYIFGVVWCGVVVLDGAGQCSAVQ